LQGSTGFISFIDFHSLQRSASTSSVYVVNQHRTYLSIPFVHYVRNGDLFSTHPVVHSASQGAVYVGCSSARFCDDLQYCLPWLVTTYVVVVTIKFLVFWCRCQCNAVTTINQTVRDAPRDCLPTPV